MDSTASQEYKFENGKAAHAYTVGISAKGHFSVILTNDDRFVWRVQKRLRYANGDVLYLVCCGCESLKRKRPRPRLTMFRDRSGHNRLITDPNDAALVGMHFCSGNAEAKRKEQRERKAIFWGIRGESQSADLGSQQFDISQNVDEDSDCLNAPPGESEESFHSITDEDLGGAHHNQTCTVVKDHYSPPDHCSVKPIVYRQPPVRTPTPASNQNNDRIRDFLKFVESSIRTFNNPNLQNEVMFQIHGVLNDVSKRQY